MKFDPELKRFVGMFLVLALFAALPGMIAGYFLSGVFVIMAAFSLYFFRDPDRFPPEDSDVLVSPADGEIVFVGEFDDPAFGECLRIGIFMNIFDVHVNRAPCDGVVELIEHVDGGYKHAGTKEAFAQNERQKIFFDTPKGPVQVHQIAGMVARRVICRVQEKQKLTRGERIGIIRFGSRVELLTPRNKTESLVAIGDKVKCGESAIARWT